MPIDRRFAAEAARGAVAMVLVPLTVVGGLSLALNPQTDWQDIGRGAGFVLVLYAVVMLRRYRQRPET